MPSHAVTDPADVIRGQPPGSCLWARWLIPPTTTGEVGWLMRETTLNIRALGDPPDVEWRAGAQIDYLTPQRPVVVVAIVIRVGAEQPEHLWESWLNACADGGHEALEDLARQDRLVTHWYGDTGTRERSLVTPNRLASFAMEVLITLDSFPQAPRSWTMSHFDQARARMEDRYPSVSALWEGLRRMG